MLCDVTVTVWLAFIVVKLLIKKIYYFVEVAFCFLICETESTPQLVDVDSFNNSTNKENSDTTKDRSDASKNDDDFSTIVVNSEIKKAIIAASPKHPEAPFPKDPLQSGRLFSTNYYHYGAQSGLKLRTLVMSFIKHGPCLLPALLVIFS